MGKTIESFLIKTLSTSRRPSSQAIPWTACSALRPRWCSDHSP